ncbi:RDD family protein [Aureimonas pseudogalii]|uniref:Putative RDD family membrane protein YckC n=1 Tax=Aureimonas pseudogalii TaxID=1744844 RepID=A0A7W6ML51_9HYPH|nr:RDD family protein [Aureimonas pseudogalii]MBB3999450.1 putative RDD family membrane protein YckC [Aureimonas pseudogalii]
MEPSSATELAGFRRRVAAFLIDWAICALLLACYAVLLFAATNGRSQFIPDLVPRGCQEVDPVPSGLTFPGFNPNQARFCRQTIFGWPAAQILTLTESTVDGYVTINRNVRLAIDADRMTEGGDVNRTPTEALLVLFRLVLDTFARSPGRRICGIAVVDGATGRRASFSRLWRRYLLYSIPIGIGYLDLIPGAPDVWSSDGSRFSIGVGLLPILAIFALLFWNVVSINARRPAYYDRPVGTSVERR